MPALIMLLQAFIAIGPEGIELFKRLFPGTPIPTWDQLKEVSNQIDILIAQEMAKT